MKRVIYTAALLSLVATTGGCRRAATVIKEECKEEVKLFSRKFHADSLHAMLEVSVDSPKIVIEYIDSPRRVVIASARKVSARERVATATNEKSETAVEAISDVKIHEREKSRPESRLWIAGVIAVVAAYIAGRFRRHTS
ncbi:MAG: hypothetical protein K2M00_06670 [Muribaculaceae bacterium]|nr:hypothetical protein [Muribaculaceae bacterium]